MRRIRIAAASVMVAAGLIGAVAPPASADPPGLLKPSTKHVNCGTTDFTLTFCARVDFMNNTAAPVFVLDIVLSGRNPGQFVVNTAVGSPCTEGVAVPQGGICSLNLFFNPSLPTGHRSANLFVFDATSDEAARVGIGARSINPF
jgi:hypothetical protein